MYKHRLYGYCRTEVQTYLTYLLFRLSIGIRVQRLSTVQIERVELDLRF